MFVEDESGATVFYKTNIQFYKDQKLNGTTAGGHTIELIYRDLPEINPAQAKALAQETPVIFLDEPTAFLDYPSKVDVLLLLKRISRQSQKTIFLSTHDLELALQVADTVWLMDRHDGLLTGTPKELARQGSLGQFIERGGGVTFNAETLTVCVKS